MITMPIEKTGLPKERQALQQAIDKCAGKATPPPAPVCCTQNCNQGRDCPLRQKGT